MGFKRKISRRQFMKGAAIAGGAMMMQGLGPFVRNARAYSYSMGLRKFIQPMPQFGAGIPLAQTAGTPYEGVDYYQLKAGVFRQQLHPDLPNSIQAGVPGSGQRLYGYTDHRNIYAHLGGAIVAPKDRAVRFSFASALPASYILPYDTGLPSPGNGGDRKDRAAVHLHGGLVPWPSDGGPFHWQSNPANAGGLQYGSSVTPWLWNGSTNVWEYYYPNHQSARFMWYHDHAVAETRLNAYAGLATGYIITDAVEAALPIPAAEHIVFQDKVFWDPANDPFYTDFVGDALPGDLWYAWEYDPAIWPIARGGTPPSPSAVPEFFGDTMLANGVVYPFHNVNQATYRFRLLNACNGRFLDLSFVQENGSTGEPLLVGMAKKQRTVAANVDVWQIGTEGGFLPAPVPLVLNGAPVQPFILGPAERADILVTFKAPGNVILYNVAGSPFPGGAPIFDWYIGNKWLPVQPTAGSGPNTRTIMRFTVGPAVGPVIPAPAAIPVASIPTQLDLVNGGLMVDATAFATQFPGYTYDAAQPPEELTLNEVVEPPGFAGVGTNTGRLLALVGNRAADPVTAVPFGPGGIYYFEAPTEFVQYNTLRIWKVYNMTGDAHPMHFHLFNVQILGRQRVDKTFLPKAPAVPPMPNELGFKETVVMYPGEATIVAALVEDPLPAPQYPREAGTNRPQIPVTPTGGATVNSTVPFSPRLQAFGVNGDEYVWHCHILEHEEHDMMRPLVATTPPA